MARHAKTDFTDDMPMATTPEAQESQMCAWAIQLAAKQLREGTASSQVIVHYLKLASVKERHEREKLEAEITLLKAKADAYEATADHGEKYEAAIRAMRSYRGEEEDSDEYPY